MGCWYGWDGEVRWVVEFGLGSVEVGLRVGRDDCVTMRSYAYVANKSHGWPKARLFSFRL